MVCSSTLRGRYPSTGRRISICRLIGEAIAWNVTSKFAHGALTTGLRATHAAGRYASTHARLNRDVRRDHVTKGMPTFQFAQVNVFSADPLGGNPLAVVHAAEGLSEAQMAALARWTNLSETTFLLAPTDPDADYYVRIFTPGGELPFAGHPTLGSCHAWLAAGGKPRKPGLVVQQCGVGLVRVRCDGPRLEFAAPPLLRTGALEPDVLAKIAKALAVLPSDIVHHQWVDNGPGWCAVMLRSARQVLSLKPDWASLDPLKLGVVGPHDAGHGAAFG